MTTTTHPLTVQKRSPAYWRVTIDNPPINLYDPEFVVDLRDLVDRLDADDQVKVVVFDSADPEFFIPHLDLARAGEIDQTPGPSGWFG